MIFPVFLPLLPVHLCPHKTPTKIIFRVILASVSSYFRVLFQCRTWIDSDNFVIYVDDAICSENILRQLVDFAYTQNIQIRPGNDAFSAENHHFRPKIGVSGK